MNFDDYDFIKIRHGAGLNKTSCTIIINNLFYLFIYLFFFLHQVTRKKLYNKSKNTGFLISC